jgi:predicted nucleotidyltransferase
MIALSQSQIEELCRKYSVRRLWVFGSAVTDQFDHEKSDVDFVVEYEPATDLGPWLKCYFELKESLEALLGRDVDLVDRRAIKNPFFKQAVEEQEVLVYGPGGSKDYRIGPFFARSRRVR